MSAQGEITMRKVILALALSALPCGTALGDEDIVGTYKLISSTRTIVETGQVEDSYGKHPNGYVMYGRDGRMLLLITHEGRPMPSRTNMTDKDRADQYRTLNEYGGTYTFHGNSIEHHIDIAVNETRVGTTEIREATREGNRLIYKTKPQPFSADGKISVITLVWEKIP
jgi:hypothetical protein